MVFTVPGSVAEVYEQSTPLGPRPCGHLLPHTIYALVESDTGEVRYVGRTRFPLSTRLIGHAQKEGSDSRIGEWLSELSTRGATFCAIVLSTTVNGDDSRAIETAEIKRRAPFGRLVNTKHTGTARRHRYTRARSPVQAPDGS